MKILLIGPSAAGKTTFVLAMYGAMQSEVEGVRIRAPSLTEHWRLLWRSFRMGWGAFPAPSDRRTIYPFLLVYRSRKLVKFTLHDYRGGVLDDPSGEAQTGELLRDLDDAGGIILFCDSTWLTDEETARDHAGTLAGLVFRTLEEKRRKMPVVLAFTKSDVSPVPTPEQSRVFSSLVRGLRAAAGDRCAVVALSCGPFRRNVATPVAFCLHAWAEGAAEAAGERARQDAKNAADLRRRAGFWDTVISGLQDLPTNKELAERADQRAAEARRERGELEEVRASLWRISQRHNGLM